MSFHCVTLQSLHTWYAVYTFFDVNSLCSEEQFGKLLELIKIPCNAQPLVPVDRFLPGKNPLLRNSLKLGT